jgi:SAM-dependent methyltransferase
LRLARRGYDVTAVDISAANLRFLARQAESRGLPVTVHQQDMRDLRTRGLVDAAICLQNAQGYLLTNGALITHLRAVRRILRHGGLYIFDRFILSSWRHPVCRWSWSRRRRRIVVRASFAVLRRPDPVGQLFDEDLTLEVLDGGRRRIYRQRQRSRLVFPQELRTLVRLAGGLELIGWFPRFNLGRPLARSRNSVMMVVVLRRTR